MTNTPSYSSSTIFRTESYRDAFKKYKNEKYGHGYDYQRSTSSQYSSSHRTYEPAWAKSTNKQIIERTFRDVYE